MFFAKRVGDVPLLGLTARTLVPRQPYLQKERGTRAATVWTNKPAPTTRDGPPSRKTGIVCEIPAPAPENLMKTT